MTTVYQLAHSQCGHTAGLSRDRSLLLAWKNKLTIHGHKGWTITETTLDVIVTEPTPAVQMLDGERCAICTVDGNTREVIR